MHVHVDRRERGDVDHGATVPSSSWSAAPQASRSQSAPGRPISDTLTGSPLRRPTPDGQRHDGEPGPVPVVGQGEVVEISEGLVVAAAAHRRDDRDGRLDDGIDPVLGEPVAPGVRVLRAAFLANEVLHGRHRPLLGVLEARAVGEAVVVASALEAPVPRQHLGEHEVQVLGEHVEPSRGWRRLDAFGGKRCERSLEPVGDVRVEVGDARRHGVPAKLSPILRRLDACQRSEQRLAVGHRTSHRPGVVEGRRQGHDPAEREEPARGLDRRRPALRRRDAKRAGSVGPGRRGNLLRCEGGSRASARTARRALERPGVADLVGRPAAGELVRMEMAEQHHALGAESRPGVAVARGNLVEDPARRGQGLAGDGVEILQPDRDAAELGRVARGEPLVGAIGRRLRVLLVDAYPRIDGRRIAVMAVVAVTLADPCEAGVDELARRERARPEHGRCLEHSEICGMAHAAILPGPIATRARATPRPARIGAARPGAP